MEVTQAERCYPRCLSQRIGTFAQQAPAQTLRTEYLAQSLLFLALLRRRHKGTPEEGLLEMNRNWSERALDAIGAGVLILDRQGLVKFASQPASAILGRPASELVGSCVDQLLAPLPQLGRRAPGTGRVEIDVVLKGGATRTMGVYLSKFLDEGVGEDRYECLFQDITPFIELRRDRDRLLQYATLNQILPGVLHELRNPLASADAMLEILVEEASGRLQEDLHALLGEIRRMGLSLQGVGAVGQQLRSDRYQAIDLAVEEAMRVMQGLASRTGVELWAQVATMPLLPLSTTVMKAITFNLVDNAIAACTASGRVSVRAQIVEPRVFELVVEDNGRGMTSEVRRRCTELFFSTKPRGSGIGLTLCEQTVKAAGGTFSIESEEHRGTRVTVRISFEKA